MQKLDLIIEFTIAIMITYGIKNAEQVLTCSTGISVLPIVNRKPVAENMLSSTKVLVVSAVKGFAEGLTIELAGTPVASDSITLEVGAAADYSVNETVAGKFTTVIKCIYGIYARAKRRVEKFVIYSKRALGVSKRPPMVAGKLQYAGGLRL